MKPSSMDLAVGMVLAADACSGCGACTLIDPGLRMQIADDGFARPVRVASIPAENGMVDQFRQTCPGVQVRSPAKRLHSHPTMGTYVAAWSSWAADAEIRHRGSSGGALTALSTWLLESGRAQRTTGVAPATDPRRTIPVTITTREEALAASGSRYAPVAAAGNPACRDAGTAVIAKPCEAAALRTLESGDAPLIMSFFCAGTPSDHATMRLLDSIGAPTDRSPDQMWYRGRGWPGEFTARFGDELHTTSYEQSWGKVLGRDTQWRCKVCIDGVGESADIVAADYWLSDDRGFPVFDDGAGVSALIARTERGRQVIEEAIAAGVLVAEPLGLDDLAAVQPLQVERRTFLLPRLIGSWLAGRRPPRYPGYGWILVRAMFTHPRQSLRVARGAWRRARAQSRS